jgi:hypothetical protein
MPRRKLIRPWTEEELERLREMSTSGRSIAAMSVRLGRSSGPVSAMLKRLGLPSAQDMHDQLKARRRAEAARVRPTGAAPRKIWRPKEKARLRKAGP